MINRKHDYEKIREAYQVKKRIVIPDFLTEEVAEFIYQGFQDISEKNLWFQVNYGNPNFFNKNLRNYNTKQGHFSYKYEKYPLKNIKLNNLLERDARRWDWQKLNEIAGNPEHELPDYHPFRKVGDMLDSKETHDLISLITGHKLTYERSVIFASRYRANDFNGAHNDGNMPRAAAFVLNMTKHWLPHWGGNLVIFDKDYENIIEAYMPRFNSFVLFDVPLPHAVLPVSAFCQSERLALSGWYHDYNKG